MSEAFSMSRASWCRSGYVKSDKKRKETKNLQPGPAQANESLSQVCDLQGMASQGHGKI